MIEAYRVAIQTAFIAIASRIVGSGFRVGETFNPELQKAGLVMKPEVVIKREAITMGLAWCFALLTNIGIAPLCKRMGIGKELGIFLTSLIGTATAETVARTIAYRNLKPNVHSKSHTPDAKPVQAFQSILGGGGRIPSVAALVKPQVKPPVVTPPSVTRTAYAYNPYANPVRMAPLYPGMMPGR